MQHTAKCLAQQAEMKRKHDEYVEKWPNYCRKCGGAGEVSRTENQSPIGSGLVWLETLYEFCEHCIGNAVCPRCGKQLPDESGECAHCGWDYGAEACPPAGLEEPCECEVEEWERQSLRF
jgi:hypothetical protein